MKNEPSIWINDFPFPKVDDHKYKRGHCVVFGAQILTGATRLASEAASRLCGLTTVVSPSDSVEVYRASLKPHIMVRESTGHNIEHNFSDQRVKAVLAGSGGGYGDEFFRNLCFRAWEQEHLNGIVLDAEAFKAWRGGMLEDFISFENGRTVITPHEGEFEYVFSQSTSYQSILDGGKEERAIKAAKLLNATVVLKGHETIIAAPNGEYVVNDNAQPFLATAGSGDVLAGMIGGLIASSMEPFKAACCGVWMHGRASEILGVGLVASDIEQIIPKVLKEMLGIRKKVG